MCGPGESGSQTPWGYFFAGQLEPAIFYLEQGNSSSSSVSRLPLDWQLSTTMPSNVRVCLRKSTTLTRFLRNGLMQEFIKLTHGCLLALCDFCLVRLAQEFLEGDGSYQFIQFHRSAKEPAAGRDRTTPPHW